MQIQCLVSCSSTSTVRLIVVSLIVGGMSLCATMAPGWQSALAAPASKSSNKSASKRTTTGPVKNEAQAVSIVSSRPEVKQFVANVKKNGRKGSSSHVEFDRKENGEFVIHVYEYVPDDEESGHTATMNWYHVNAKTGKVTTEF